MVQQKVFKKENDMTLSVKARSKNDFVLVLAIGSREWSIDDGRICFADFYDMGGKVQLAYVIFGGSTNILKIATVDKRSGDVFFETALFGVFARPMILEFQDEILVFAELYTDKSKFVCVRQGRCFDLSAGGNNRLTSIIDNGDSLIAVLDCDHFIKETEPINGGVMPFDGTGIRIKRKPALLTYRLTDVDEDGRPSLGIERSDTDAFLQGGAEIVQLAKYRGKIYAAYMRFEKFSYIIYVTDFGKSQVVVDTHRIIRSFKYRIEGDEHIIDSVEGQYRKPIIGGLDLDFLVGGPCELIRLKEAPLQRNIVDNREVLPSKRLQYYWGDLRVRTDLSINSHSTGWHCGSPDDKFIETKLLNNLDFCALSDIESHIDNSSWDDLRFNNDLHNIDGDFTVLNAFEWTLPKDQVSVGSYNVIFRGRADIMRSTDPENNSPAQLAKRLQNPMRRGMFVVTDPVDLLRGVNWSAIRQGDVALTEMFNAKGAFESNDGIHNPALYSRKTRDDSFLIKALDYHPLGFVGGGGHEGIGVTCVLSDALTRESIYDALVRRKCYATTGAKIILGLYIGKALMGDFIPQPSGEVKVDVEVDGTADLDFVELVTNIRTIGVKFKGRRANTTVSVNAGFRYIYLRVMQQDNQAAWSSPIFVGNKK